MKGIIILIALAGVPILMGIFQKKKYNNTLKPELEKAALAIMENAGVDKVDVVFDHLDATLSGITVTEGDRESLRKAVDDLGKGAVRAYASSDLKTHGDLQIAKVGDVVSVNGHFAEGTWDKAFAKPLTDGGVELTKGDSYYEKDYFINPNLAIPTASSTKLIGDFLALPGDRGIKMNSKTNEATLYGEITERQKKNVLASAAAAGIAVLPAFDIIPAKPIKLTTQSSTDGVMVSGIIPDDLDLDKYNFKTESLKVDPFTDGPAGVYADGFKAWNDDYYGDLKARRGYVLEGGELTLSGYATPFMLSGWTAEASKLKLKPVTNKLEVYPSSFHYPNYERVSKISEEDLGKLNEAFALNQVFFETGSSEVIGGEVYKVDSLAAAITAFGKGAQFVLGGHADSTGNVAINKKLSKERSQAVLAGLVERGVDQNIFTLTSFGSSKAKKAGDSSSDRRVEILVK